MMDLLTAITILFSALLVEGGSKAITKAGAGSAGTDIAMLGAAEVIGYGGSTAEHIGIVSVLGSPQVPALLNLYTGSNTGLSQYTSNYQSTQINSDGSSSAYQGNSASNSGYASATLYGEAQGLDVNVETAGLSAVEGEGAVGQVDNLEHQGSGSNSGWKKP